jgi:uncharacterized protein with FMN-binding domain
MGGQLMSKINSKWITLCTAAIGITYASGYIITEPKTTTVLAASEVQVQSQNRASKSLKHVYQTDSSSDQSSQENSDNQNSSAEQTSSKYKDGTYTGEGMNHIGSVSVSVTINNGKIEGVKITDCTTSYPESKIDKLPQQVVARQSSNVDNVSGATESTNDFITAVMNALSQAQA